MVKLTVVVDNKAIRGLRAAWGLSMVVEKGDYRLIFDTGPDEKALSYNLSKLKIDGNFNMLVLSHLHWDHVGGLSAVIKNTREFCLPEPMNEMSEVCTEPKKIGEFAISTGVFESAIREQALIVIGDNKTALLVGCSHPGIENIVLKAKELVGGVDVVIGGFHLLNANHLRLKNIVRIFERLNVREIYGIHCTGQRAMEYMRNKLGSRVKDGYAGLQLYL